MTAIQVNGTIDNPDPIYTYNEPTSPFAGGGIAAGVLTQVAITGFKNTGNMPQTLAVNIANPTGVTVNDWYIEVPGSTDTPKTVTLSPGQSATLRVNITAPDTGPGADTSYSFEIDSTWTHA